MGESAIEWTDATWNPTTGCDRVSPGCAHCYALELAPKLRRFARARERKALDAGETHTPGKWLNVRDGGKTSGPAFGMTLHPDALTLPLRWRRPRLVFVNSMSDLFHEEVPDEFIAEVFATMALAGQHTFQVLTKRPERMAELLPSASFRLAWAAALRRDGLLAYAQSHVARYGDSAPPWPLPNVWLGVSIENRRFVHRADLLRATPAAVRFISAEPLLGPLVWDAGDGLGHQTPTGYVWNDYTGPELDLTDIDWLIAGGESGPKHRPIREEWLRDLRDACAAAGTAFFFKQWGGRTPKSGGRELDGRTWDELPARSQDIEVARAPAFAAVATNDEETR